MHYLFYQPYLLQCHCPADPPRRRVPASLTGGQRHPQESLLQHGDRRLIPELAPGVYLGDLFRNRRPPLRVPVQQVAQLHHWPYKEKKLIKLLLAF